MAIFNVYDRRLKEQLERKGFLFSGSQGEGLNKPIQFTMAGPKNKISKREMPFVYPLGTLRQKSKRSFASKRGY